MNDHHDHGDFEKKLHALAASLHRPDPTPAWKADILARARREANAVPIQRMLPPRPLVLLWAAAWAAVVFLSFTTPRDVEHLPASYLAASHANQQRESTTAAVNPPETLLAFHRQYNFTNDLP